MPSNPRLVAQPLVSLKFTWPIFSSPAIAGDTVYFGSHDGILRAVDLKTARSPGLSKPTAPPRISPAFSKPDGTTNYETVFTENFYDNLIVGVYKLFATGSILSSPVVAGDSLYFGSTDGNLYALN